MQYSTTIPWWMKNRGYWNVLCSDGVTRSGWLPRLTKLCEMTLADDPQIVSVARLYANRASEFVAQKIDRGEPVGEWVVRIMNLADLVTHGDKMMQAKSMAAMLQREAKAMSLAAGEQQ